jgi:hypothetical protein
MRFPIIYFLIISFLFSSCAIHQGTLVNSSASVHDAEITYRDIAVGYSKSSYVLGIGGLSKDALVFESKRNLMLNYPLKENEFFNIVSLDQKVTFLFLYSRNEVIITADIMESSGKKIVIDEAYSKWLATNTQVSVDNFSIKEQVLLLRKNVLIRGRIVAVDKSSARVFYFDSHGKMQVNKVSYSSLFKAENSEGMTNEPGMRVGDEGYYQINWQSGKPYSVYGKILGINNEMLLIETDGKYKTVLRKKLNPNSDSNDSGK